MNSNWKKIRPARLAANIKQVDLALSAGVSQMAISLIERGTLKARAETVANILDAIERLAASRES